MPPSPVRARHQAPQSPAVAPSNADNSARASTTFATLCLSDAPNAHCTANRIAIRANPPAPLPRRREKLDHKTHLSSQSARAHMHVLQSRALTTSGMKTLHPNATTGATERRRLAEQRRNRASAEGCRSRLPRWLRASRGRRDRPG
jgi:hypothetical protein